MIYRDCYGSPVDGESRNDSSYVTMRSLSKAGDTVSYKIVSSAFHCSHKIVAVRPLDILNRCETSIGQELFHPFSVVRNLSENRLMALVSVDSAPTANASHTSFGIGNFDDGPESDKRGALPQSGSVEGLSG